MDHSIQNFKQEIEAMFQNSFQQLNQKNQLNKNILSNLFQAANEQSKRIAQMDQKVEELQSVYMNQNEPQTNFVKKQVRKHQELLHDNYNMMMHRLQQIQEGINNSKRNMENNIQINQQSQQKMDKMIRHMEQISAKQQIPEYKGDKNTLFREIELFENLLKNQMQKEKGIAENAEFAQKTVLQPLGTYETKMAVHNKANQQILKDKLSGFTDKIKKLEKKVEETTWMMNSQITKSNQEQRKIIDEMNSLENQMGKLRNQLQNTDQKRKQTMQSHALSLDNMVEEMLSEAKKLEVRVQSLRKGYEDQNQKLKKQIGNQKMTL